MKDLIILPAEIEQYLVEYIEEKKGKLNNYFLGKAIRDDVLDLLDHFCTVIYYPLKDETNYGFHMTDNYGSFPNDEHFVFINTSRKLIEQVFAAAHELGHIWKVDEYVCAKTNKCIDEVDEDYREQIINRFAAVLLMPSDIFSKSVVETLELLNAKDESLDFIGILKLIIILMNQFLVPMESVIRRMAEITILSRDNAISLLTFIEENSVIQGIIKQLVIDLGCTRLNITTEKKWIRDLSELLDKAEHDKSVSQLKIDNLRKLFDIEKPITIENEKTFEINTQGSNGNNDN